MNALKARLITVKNRVCRHLRKKRTNSRRRIGVFGRRVSSSLKRIFTIHRLRLKIRRRRSQVSRCRDQEKETGPTSQPPCEGGRVQNTRPSEVAPTQLSDETSSLSRSGTPFTVPTLTLLPPCTPTSSCLSATPRSPSLTSWDSWSSFESSDKEDDSISSTDSELSLSDSLFTSSDDDDNEEMEGEDESESTCNKQLQAEFGTEIIGNCIHVFPIVSSGIIADCSVAQSDDNDSESDKFVTVSRTSSEEELGMISGIEDEDMDESQMVFTELQNTVPGMSAFIPPQVPVHSKCSISFKPAETNFVRYTTKPAPLTLSLSGDDSHIPTTPPPCPSTVKDIDAEEMWKEYAKNRSTAPEYFLFPPFTPEQEEWIVATNHPFKEYVVQTWPTSIHSSIQGWLEDLVN